MNQPLFSGLTEAQWEEFEERAAIIAADGVDWPRARELAYEIVKRAAEERSRRASAKAP